nr:pectate lyase [Ferruginibacter sp.]
MKKIIIIISFIIGQSSFAQQIAFPNAEGFGKFASGGRGGQVVAVTNLNDSGEGSFRNALEKFPNEPLTIIFKVSGIIELQSKIQIKRSNLTIAGQTAPGDGICLKNQSLILNGASAKGNHGNIIIRFIRSRPGGTDKKGLYGFDMENCHDVIIDHCSFSWANEECAAMYDTKNTTVQWCIVSEGLYNAGHMKGNRSYGGVWG